jgi:hypothetical protein
MNKVYVVMKGYDYEGYTDIDMKVFAVKADAEAYAQSLRDTAINGLVDYVSIFEHDIH